jgi:hypothetical protein
MSAIPAYLVLVAIAGVFYLIAKAIHRRPMAAWLVPAGLMLIFFAALIYGTAFLLGVESKIIAVGAYVLAFCGTIAFGLGLECCRISHGFGFWGMNMKDREEGDQDSQSAGEDDTARSGRSTDDKQ